MPTTEGLPSSNRLDFSRSVPLSLAAVIKQGLAAEPDQRFADAKAMHGALRHDALQTLTDGIIPAGDEPHKTKPRSAQTAATSNKESSRLAQAQQDYETQINNSALDHQPLSERENSLGNALDSSLSSGFDSSGSRQHSGALFTGLANSIDADTLTALKADFSAQFGREGGIDANRILHQQIEDAISVAELIHALAKHIDQPKKGQRFVQRWSS